MLKLIDGVWHVIIGKHFWPRPTLEWVVEHDSLWLIEKGMPMAYNQSHVDIVWAALKERTERMTRVSYVRRLIMESHRSLTPRVSLEDYDASIPSPGRC